MNKKLFISDSHYNSVVKFKCPLNMGFWHYSPNGCCVLINQKTETIHHLYLRESCTLTRTGATVQKLLLKCRDRDCIVEGQTYDGGDDDDDEIYDAVLNNTTADVAADARFFKVKLQPYMNSHNNTTIMTFTDQCIFNNMTHTAKQKLLEHHDEMLQQFWFIVCDLGIPVDVTTTSRQNKITESTVHRSILNNIFGPLVFCSSEETFSNFLSTITNRFIHQQMPVLNNMTADSLLSLIEENIRFVSTLPAQKMMLHQRSSDLLYLDARDLFDIIKPKNTDFVTNMRTVHLTNETTFLDTWRRLLFNFVHELANIKTFDKQNIRVRSSCGVQHFLQGNNKTVIPEFRCNSSSPDHCIHLETRRQEYKMQQMRNSVNLDTYATESTVKTSLELTDAGPICRFVLDALVMEYGADKVDKEFNFTCFFNNSVFEHDDPQAWEKVISKTLNLDIKLHTKEGSAVPRERISCIQRLCKAKRMNDVHRFCLPKRFLTLMWFQWACSELKLQVFDFD